MELLQNEQYREDLRWVAALPLPWEKLGGNTVVIAGATGMIGKFIIDVLMEKNHQDALDCTVVALGRNAKKASERFASYLSDPYFIFTECDINAEMTCAVSGADYILHLASATHPRQYAADPVGTISANVIGTNNLLRFAAAHDCRRFLFASSVEIYGESRGENDRFDESYCGIIDCNTMRAGYPESKRTGEALCQAYRASTGLEVVIPRLARTFGPTMQESDSKAVAQFIKNGVTREDIVLKSRGEQFYSYSYIADAVSGLFTCLLAGKDGEAYNIADEGSDVTLRDLAGLIAEDAGSKVVFELPEASESAGYSKATRAVMESGKLKALGWNARYDMKEGITRTLAILRDCAAHE